MITNDNDNDVSMLTEIRVDESFYAIKFLRVQLSNSTLLAN